MYGKRVGIGSLVVTTGPFAHILLVSRVMQLRMGLKISGVFEPFAASLVSALEVSLC